MVRLTVVPVIPLALSDAMKTAMFATSYFAEGRPTEFLVGPSAADTIWRL
jgi:hypothetical protein